MYKYCHIFNLDTLIKVILEVYFIEYGVMRMKGRRIDKAHWKDVCIDQN